ncbi:hypothetical protein MF672_027920 [Actinomadura sp. ATCC 31491]|uniref:Uncharacterized protein n=1 Tax=Actinomadura luzonensis TaxID=2805427 RepID=A0ABT0FZ31_9ACTN|nr:hypothetical protein [Actinomadura luzonensis]MCK2217592.1 hypothetical protein [Actinomadura luzonensis]
MKQILFRLCSAGTQKTAKDADNCWKAIPQLRATVGDKPKVIESRKTELGLQADSSPIPSLTWEGTGTLQDQGTSGDDPNALSSASLALAEASGTR